MIEEFADVGVDYTTSDTLSTLPPCELCKQHLLYAAIGNRDVSIFPRVMVVVKSPIAEQGDQHLVPDCAQKGAKPKKRRLAIQIQ